MKKVALLLLLLLVGVFVTWRLWPTSHVDYIARITGIHIPAGSKQIAAYEHDWCVVAKYRLQPEKTEGFHRAHSFGSFSKLHEESPMKIDYLSQNLDGSRSGFRKKEGIVALRGRTKTNVWEFVLEPATLSLWVVVEFPDMAGDLP